MSVREFFQTMRYGAAPEAPDTADAWLERHARQFDLFIDNQWVPPRENKRFASVAPATGREIARIADASAADVDAAYRAARTAFASWSALSGHARARHLYAIARGVQKHARLLAVLESLDNGKSIRESRDLDVPLVARHFYHHAGWAQLMERELPGCAPLGVVGQIIPWNFPLLMLAWKIAPALAMGNTVVIKPAPFTSLTALLFAEIVAEAGVPAGVVNIVTGGDDTGIAITAQPGFDKIAFTGSTHVGKIIRRATAGRGIKLSLELGGKSPFIVFDDADQDAAVEGLVDAIWFNQGQVCCAGSRVLVQENIADSFYAKVQRRMDTLRIGDSLDKSIDIGAVIHAEQRDIIEKWVALGVEQGAELYQTACELPASGTWYPPTLLTHVEPASAVAQEEIFGPVAVAMTFRTPKEAVALANNTRYGLAASIWSENINLALDAAQKVKAGSVWVNCTNLFDAAAGFGGYRESGYGREGGREGLYEYTRPRWQREQKAAAESGQTAAAPSVMSAPLALNGHTSGMNGAIDRTAKLFIGGKQARPDGNYSRPITRPDGRLLGEVGEGNRKDIRDAVEAARAAHEAWAAKHGHARAQILYYLAENLSVRTDEFARRIAEMTGASPEAAALEVEQSIERLFTYAAYADKFGGTIQETTLRGIVLGVREPVGVIGIACPDEAPLLALISLVAPALARGNTVVVIPSERHPLAATDWYQVVETSDVPPGVINIVTGARDVLSKTLAQHDHVESMWYFGTPDGAANVEKWSADNMKRTWAESTPRVWSDDMQGAGDEFLHQATQFKNIWVPTGE
jgi:aldehyde dehydrogenase (NAD+)